MQIANSEALRNWLREHSYDALGELPSFDVPQEEYEKHLADVRAQGLHADEGLNQARAVYRCLTSHLGPAAALAGKTEAYEKITDAAKKEILQATAADAGAALQFMVKFYDRTEQQFHLQRSGIETLLAVHHATQEMIREQAKRFKIGLAIVLFLLAALLFLVVPKAHGQDKPVSSAKPVASLVVPDSYKLRIRDVQYAKDKVLIRLQNLQLQEQRVSEEAAARDKTINEIVYQLAVEEHIDLSKWVMDLDTLSWQPKEK